MREKKKQNEKKCQKLNKKQKLKKKRKTKIMFTMMRWRFGGYYGHVSLVFQSLFDYSREK